MARFKYADSSQGLFMTVNLKEQLQPDTFEWAVDQLVEMIDLSIFEQNYNNDEKGADAYPPSVLLKVILFCYSRGQISSREIERACKENVVVKALAKDMEPDHSTIAAFISSNGEAVKRIFVQVLLQCAELGLINGEIFGLDGCKQSSNASKEWSGKVAELKKKREKLGKYIERVIQQHKKLDQDKKAQKIQKKYKKTLEDAEERRKKSVKKLKKKFRWLTNKLENLEPRKGVSGGEVKSNLTDPQSSLIKTGEGYVQGYNGVTVADAANQIIICAKAIGSGPESGSFPEMLDMLNENMKLVTKKEEPLKASLVLADTGLFTEKNLQEAAERNIEVLIPDQQFRQRDPYFADKKNEKVKKQPKKYTHEDFEYDKKKDEYICPCGESLKYIGIGELRNNTGRKYQAKKGSCANCPDREKCITEKKSKKPSKNPVRTLYIAEQKYEENLSEKMREKIDDPVYRELYTRRMQIIEPVFANITHCKGMDHFTLRGEEKVNLQWNLYCIVHNIGKCIKSLSEKYASKVGIKGKGKAKKAA